MSTKGSVLNECGRQALAISRWMALASPQHRRESEERNGIRSSKDLEKLISSFFCESAAPTGAKLGRIADGSTS